MADGDFRFWTGFSSSGGLGSDVLDQGRNGGHATDNDTGVDLHHAMLQ